MKKRLLASLALAPVFVIAGCRHQKVQLILQPPPPPPTAKALPAPHTTLADMPVLPESVPPNVTLGGTVETAPQKHDWRHSADAHSSTASNAANSQDDRNAASGGELPNTTPIGSLSAAPNTEGLPSPASIEKEIHQIQEQLHQIHHTLNPRQQRTASQIRAFLAKAENALQADDLDGANNLTTKARVLLGEIQ
jgi:hypothetical protein